MTIEQLAFWKCFVILSGRGGVGKTLIASLLTAALLLRDRAPAIIEADMQRRLELLFPKFVQLIDIDQLDALAEDPMALARAFAAIPQAARDAADKRRDVVIDSAATWHLPLIKYVAEIKLGAKIRALNGELIFLIPVTADADAIILGLETAEKIEQLVPDAEVVFVLNQHPHAVRFDIPAVSTVYGAEKAKRLLGSHRQVRLQSVPDKIWGNFERSNMSVLDVATADASDLIGVAEADVDTVEIMQGRIQSWLNSFLDEMQPLLQFRDEP